MMTTMSLGSPISLETAIQEYGRRHRSGDVSALTDFESQYGRFVQMIISRVLRSNRARSCFEKSLLLHLRRMTSLHEHAAVDRQIVRRVCEAMLAYSPMPHSTPVG